MLYWMKVGISEDEKEYDKQEINAVIYLLEKNLFSQKFKENRRKNKDTNINNLNRRKEDKIVVNLNSKNLLNKYDDLALKNKLDSFKKGLIKADEEESSKLINKYG